jgi:hypothetical protein
MLDQLPSIIASANLGESKTGPSRRIVKVMQVRQSPPWMPVVSFRANRVDAGLWPTGRRDIEAPRSRFVPGDYIRD